MPKTAVAAALAALILAAVAPTAQAMPVASHHSIVAGLNSDIQDSGGDAAARPLGTPPLPDLLARSLGARSLSLTPRSAGARPTQADVMRPPARPRRRSALQAPPPRFATRMSSAN